jgi:hypothetical protein
MTNISKKMLSVDQTTLLFSQLASLFANKPKAKIEKITHELLGPEEQIMLAKRFVAILLIHREQTPYFIASTLYLSQSTVGKLLERYDAGKYKYILEAVDKPTPEIATLLKTIDSILHLGGILPHYGQSKYPK